MHRLFAQDPYRSEVPWSGTHLFRVSERCVSVEDPAGNYGLTSGDFLDEVSIPKDQVYPIPVDASHEEGAETYQSVLIMCISIRPKHPVAQAMAIRGEK